MPFGGWNDRYYEEILAPAIDRAGLEPKRADGIYGPAQIIHDIWRQVRKAPVLVADLTGRNPNVFYELGLAHAIGKPVVLLSKTTEDIPFDLQGTRTIIYDVQSPTWAKELATALTKSLGEVTKSPKRFVPAPFLTVDASERAPTVSALEQRLVAVEQAVSSFQSTGLSPSVLGLVRALEVRRFSGNSQPHGLEGSYTIQHAPSWLPAAGEGKTTIDLAALTSLKKDDPATTRSNRFSQ